jgi:hypothetical protein
MFQDRPMRSRQASSAARSFDPAPWRDSLGLVIDLEARRVSPPAEPPARPAAPREPYTWDDFETANGNRAAPPRSRDLGSRRDRAREMSAETRLMICLVALLFFFAAPAHIAPPTAAPVVAGKGTP